MTTSTATQRVACDHCGIKVRLRRDGTYPRHDHTTYRLDARGRTRPGSRDRRQCEKSGKRHDLHRGTFYATKRSPDGVATEWGAFCRCGEKWTGPDYDSAETSWWDHARAATQATDGAR